MYDSAIYKFRLKLASHHVVSMSKKVVTLIDLHNDYSVSKRILCYKEGLSDFIHLIMLYSISPLISPEGRKKEVAGSRLNMFFLPARFVPLTQSQ